MGTYTFMKIIIAFVYFAQTLAIGQGEYRYNYVGCFKDNSTNRALSGPSSSPASNTVEICVENCAEGSYRYAGLYLSYYCFCGDSGYDRYGEDSFGCNTNCPGNYSQKCGGVDSTSVYEIVLSTTATKNSMSTTVPAAIHSTTTTTTTTTTTGSTTRTATVTSPTLNECTPAHKGGRINLEVYISAGVGVTVGCALTSLAVVLIMCIRKKVDRAKAQTAEVVKESAICGSGDYETPVAAAEDGAHRYTTIEMQQNPLAEDGSQYESLHRTAAGAEPTETHTHLYEKLYKN